jgi:CheY-like chemotaxis protein
MTTNTIKILVVDDSEMNLLLSKKALSKWSENIDTASSGAEAIALVKENSYDLILMDIHMPDMDGYETSQQIRSTTQFEGPIFALTASLDISGDGRKEDSGLDDFIEKPFTTDKIKYKFEHFVASH